MGASTPYASPWASVAARPFSQQSIAPILNQSAAGPLFPGSAMPGYTPFASSAARPRTQTFGGYSQGLSSVAAPIRRQSQPTVPRSYVPTGSAHASVLSGTQSPMKPYRYQAK